MTASLYPCTRKLREEDSGFRPQGPAPIKQKTMGKSLLSLPCYCVNSGSAVGFERFLINRFTLVDILCLGAEKLPPLSEF